MADLRVAVAGASGRMGAASIRAVLATPGMILHSAFDRPGTPAIGTAAGPVTVGDDALAALAGADALLDFTVPAASVMFAVEASKRGMIHIIGTTGCSDEDEAIFNRAADRGARIVKSGNFSLGINVLIGLVRQAAKLLPSYDIEVLEMHHRRKVDAPSGTALMLGQAAADGRGIDLGQHSVRVRDGHTGPRPEGSIGFAMLRGGTVVGDHSVIFAGDNERIEFRHLAEDRAMFAAGAVRAALWARDQAPGRYDMADVLGLKN